MDWINWLQLGSSGRLW